MKIKNFKAITVKYRKETFQSYKIFIKKLYKEKNVDDR